MRIAFIILIHSVSLVLFSCTGRSTTTEFRDTLSGCKPTSFSEEFLTLPLQEDYSTVESDTLIQEEEILTGTLAKFEEYGLVNIQTLSPDILVELKYATTDNFTGQIAYEDFTQAWLMADIAERLAKAQEHLSSIRPGYRLLVYDAARPISVQKKLFDSVKGTPKSNYVASPTRTGLHNYGAAVDLTIVDDSNHPLDMGTEFDHLGREAHTNTEEQLLSEGKLTREQINNRKLLREVMHKEGFRVLSNEWWHFNGCSLTEAKQRYKLLDF